MRGGSLTAHRPLVIVSVKASPQDSPLQGDELALLAGALISAASLIPAALAQPACVTQNMVVPPGANTSDKAAPFFIDTTGLDFKTAPPTRDPSNPKRWNNAAFWGLYAITFLVGSRLPPFASGCLVIAMVLVASIGKLGQATRESQTLAQREADRKSVV